MLGLDRKFKVTCGNCGTWLTKLNLSRHKLRCSGGILYCPKCPNFSTKSRDDLKYHIAKKHATPRVKITHKCKICLKEFSGFHALRQRKTSEKGIQMKSAEFDVNNFLEDNDADLREELEACQFFLVDSELQKRRHLVFKFAMSTFDNPFIYKKLDLVIKGLKCAAKVKLAFGFILKNVESGSCMLTRTILLWNARNLCARQTKLPTSKINYWKWILLIFLHEREPIPIGSFTNWQIWQFLQRYSKKYPWVVKILHYLNRSWKIKTWFV